MHQDICIWRDCTYPVMQNGDGVHCREHRGWACSTCKSADGKARCGDRGWTTVDMGCKPCGVILCVGCAAKHECVPPKPKQPTCLEARAGLPAALDAVGIGFALYKRGQSGESYTDRCVEGVCMLPGAKTYDEAVAQANEIAQSYNEDDEAYPSELHVFEITAITSINVDAVVYAKRKREEEAEELAEAVATAKRELTLLAELKKKYEGTNG